MKIQRTIHYTYIFEIYEEYNKLLNEFITLIKFIYS